MGTSSGRAESEGRRGRLREYCGLSAMGWRGLGSGRRGGHRLSSLGLWVL